MHARARNQRLLGALVASGLALVLVAVGGILWGLGGWAGAFVTFIGIVALLVGSIAGWRMGPASVTGSPPDWPYRGILTVMVGLAIVNVAYVVVAVILVPANLGNAAYGLLWAAIYTVVLTFLVGVPLGAIWVRIMRRLARASDHATGV